GAARALLQHAADRQGALADVDGRVGADGLRQPGRRRRRGRPARAQAAGPGARRRERRRRRLPGLLYRRAPRGDRGAGMGAQPPVPRADLHRDGHRDRGLGDAPGARGRGPSGRAPDTRRAGPRRDRRDGDRARAVGDQRAPSRAAGGVARARPSGPPVPDGQVARAHRDRPATRPPEFRPGHPPRGQRLLPRRRAVLPLRLGRRRPALGARRRGRGADGAGPGDNGRMSTLPPGPKLAKAVQTIAMWGYWDRYLEACRRRYGDVFTVRAAPMGTLVYFADPEAIKEVFTGDAQTLHAGEANAILAPVLGERSVLVTDEADHLRRRKLMLPAFHGDAVRSYAGIVEQVTDDEDELRDQLVTLLLAGHETTATGLAWGFERLLRTPDALERTIAAARDGDDAWLDAVVQETLRVRPVIFDVIRKLSRPARIAGVDLPTGVLAAPAIGLVHRSPQLYEAPRAFRPERFLEGAPAPYTWI